MKKRELDQFTHAVGEATHTVWHLVRGIVLYFIGTVALTAFAYAIFAFVFSTDVERRLHRENKVYEKLLPELEPREQLLSDAIDVLTDKDDRIYDRMFHAQAPSVDPMSSLDFLFASDTIPDSKLVSYTRDKSDALVSRVSEVDAAFEKIIRAIADSSFVMPPMSMPVKDLSYPQVGASCGSKMNPFLKVFVRHDGIDLVANRGADVYATAAGVVAEGTGRSKTGGNTVVIRHDGGYSTVYAHLDNVNVSRGQRVKRGQKIGTVGMTGKAFAPHLHYEVHKDSLAVDPVHYFFSTVEPLDYANYLYMSVNTLQSMD